VSVEHVALKLENAEPIASVIDTAPPPAVQERRPAELVRQARRRFAFYRDKLRAIMLGALALMVFVVIWHLLTKYRVNIYVRFLNVPSPEQVLERAMRASHDPRFFAHLGLSCRRILLGFSAASVIAVPLGLLMGRFRTIRELVFPVTEVLRPIPAIAWVPMSIMLWPSNEESIVFITFLGSFFPILINTLHGMAMVDTVLVRAAQCLGAREAAIFREVYFPAALPHIFTGLTVGMGVAWVSLIAAEMISGQFGIGYFTWEAYSLVQYSDIALGMICIGVLGLASSAAIRGLGRLVMPWSR
jgi:NitT/TauT family transport system permease protein